MRKKIYKITIVDYGDIVVTKKQLEEFMEMEMYDVIRMEYIGDLVYAKEDDL